MEGILTPKKFFPLFGIKKLNCKHNHCFQLKSFADMSCTSGFVFRMKVESELSDTICREMLERSFEAEQLEGERVKGFICKYILDIREILCKRITRGTRLAKYGTRRVTTFWEYSSCCLRGDCRAKKS
jgi:hypothetical protein